MYVFEIADERLAQCVEKLNEVYRITSEIRDCEKSCNRSLSSEETDKWEYTCRMLGYICDNLDTVIEDTDRLALRDEDGSIFT